MYFQTDVARVSYGYVIIKKHINELPARNYSFIYMGATQLSNCKNCGAKLEPIVGDTAKCNYCGSVFDREEIKVSGVQTDQHETTDEPVIVAPVNDDDSVKKGCAFLFLFIVIILVIMAKTNESTGWANGLLAPNPPSDTSHIDTTTKKDKKVYIRRTNPDPQVVIKSVKVNTKYSTDVSVKFRNKTGDLITYIEFSFQLFDKKGNELKTGDSNVRGTGVLVQNGDFNTQSWTITNHILKAKSAKVKLKRVESGDTIWEY